ncbi:MAG: hypothetical protein ACYTAN_01710 [Planctomycetota bacterium]|jgi:hypothetical protein
MRKRTGSVSDTRPLVAFLYLILRDVLPAGRVESMLEQLADPGVTERVFTNGHLARLAQDIADRLLRESKS